MWNVGVCCRDLRWVEVVGLEGGWCVGMVFVGLVVKEVVEMRR